MSIIQKINPVGIDTSINNAQSTIYSYLTSTAGWTNYESYNRAYKNPREGSTIPEVYVGKNEYIEVLFNDKFNVSSYFLVEDNTSLSGELFSQNVAVIFQGILSELYPLIAHRADAEMLDDVMKAFDQTNYDVTNIITGVENVYSDVSLRNRLLEEIKLTDISDFHVLRVDFTVNYEYGCKYNEI